MNNVRTADEIPYLPIEFFKTHCVKSGKWPEVKVFKSSGTTNTGRSCHYVKDLDFYKKLTQHTFETSVGSLATFQIIAILPSYQESGDSSLIEMVNHFMSIASADSRYETIWSDELEQELGGIQQKKLLIGVSYALLDLAEACIQPLKNVLVMETGGMKGRRKEIIREELHTRLKKSFNAGEILSEYGNDRTFKSSLREKWTFPVSSMGKSSHTGH